MTNQIERKISEQSVNTVKVPDPDETRKFKRKRNKRGLHLSDTDYVIVSGW